MERCGWAGTDALMVRYHDEEWGLPVHDDRRLFEFLTLEGAQAGLSWMTILKKRETYVRVFDGFDPGAVARYDGRKVAELLADPGIVRNKLKVGATIANAGALLSVQRDFGSFDRYVWSFVGGRPNKNSRKALDEIPPQTAESEAMSKELKRRGFRFVGPTICYAFMQATGMVNDHVTSCFRYREVRAAGG